MHKIKADVVAEWWIELTQKEKKALKRKYNKMYRTNKKQGLSSPLGSLKKLCKLTNSQIYYVWLFNKSLKNGDKIKNR